MRTAEQIEHTKELVVALRSGKYQQGRSRLRTYDGRYCCLGVACIVAGVKFGPSPDDGIPVGERFGKLVFENSVMTQEVADYYGFLDREGRFTMTEEVFDVVKKYSEQVSSNDTPDFKFVMENHDKVIGQPYSLVNMNDDLGVPFSVIADIIELAPEDMFIE